MAFKSSKNNPRQYIGKAEFVGEIEKELTHLVYDCSLDLEERKKKVITLDSAAEVAALLGVKIDAVFKIFCRLLLDYPFPQQLVGLFYIYILCYDT